MSKRLLDMDKNKKKKATQVIDLISNGLLAQLVEQRTLNP